MELGSIVIIIIMGVLSVFSILVIAGVIRTRKDGVDIVLDYFKKENAELHKKLTRMEVVMNEQSKKIHNLQMQVVLLESSHYDHPYPSWMFDHQCNLIAANKAFESTFLTVNDKGLSDVMGATPNDIMDKEAAAVYLRNHKWVLSQKRPWEGGIAIQVNDKSQWFDMILYPAYSDKQIIGVSGMVIPARKVENY